jgi:hypothetical protein
MSYTNPVREFLLLSRSDNAAQREKNPAAALSEFARAQRENPAAAPILSFGGKDGILAAGL